MKDEKIILQEVERKSPYGIETTNEFQNLFFELNSIHKAFDLDEKKTEEQFALLDEEMAIAEQWLNSAYQRIMKAINK